jgi:lactoylglutathione lyase
VNIEHIAIYTPNLERAKKFYCDYFGFVAGNKYVNSSKQFESYFLTGDGGARLELMTRPGLLAPSEKSFYQAGIAHLALSVGSEEKVLGITKVLVEAGYVLVSEPRRTGDGYFESCIHDPDGNMVEITI